ncbi:DeoR/GlpR family DNA-binding transcription regulator [Gallibacterium salpingitidis]|uniref:DeoR/GlpR family DNA-binding transcription regulator n=1 Tax=Gallibacterium salpingitidis TaxID=505341 RepID=UPI00266F96FA|nr:DeoR/GlpR family DNA-binding transcription regulator [Gallibacterium salpingitidis]WKT01045.1 DeoR/GlpR family DNA-binding transcription regulator [Gallibacterium salpingitidis]
MIPAERQKHILTILAQQNIVSINSLMEMLDVSHMTIRRDIQALEKKGIVISVSGGVQLQQKLTIEPTHTAKSLLSQSEKEKIGRCAATRIPENSTVYLDAGTTTLEIARHIAERDDLLIITNDFAVADFLINHGQSELIHTGGKINKLNRSAVGELAAQFLRNISIDVAFVSTSSWSLKGLTTPDESKLAVKRAILDSSRHKTLVSDSSKYGKLATFWICELNAFDSLITDNKLPDNIQKAINNMDIELVLAE